LKNTIMKNLLLYLLLFIPFVLTAQVPNYVPSDSLVGWWGFNGNANDESGNGNDGINNGAALTTDRFGTADAAYDFDGTNHIVIPDNSALNSDYISVSIWFQTNATSFGSLIYKTDASAINEQYGCVLNYPTVDNTIWSVKNGNNCSNPGSGWQTTNMSYNLSDGVWHHIVCSYNGSLSEIYLDNLLITSGSFSASVIDPCGGEINVGKGYNSLYLFVGKIDDIGIWNRALDSNEINDLFLAISCTIDPVISQPTDQTVNIGNNATISFTDSLTAATYQWQMDAGTGYTNLSNAGQFSGTDTKTLTVSAVTMSNNNTNYRCIGTESSSCMDTTDVANLTVIDNTSIGELNNSLVQLFPNPSNDIITLTLPQHSNGQIILTDILGKEVLSKSFTSNEVQINLKSLTSKGTYFVKVHDLDGNVIAIKKLIYQ
jgi:hypothetical protein